MAEIDEPSQSYQLQSSAPEKYSIITFGCTSEASNKIAGSVYAVIREIGKLFDLERLEGVTIAADYSSALQQLDLGYPVTIPLVPTSDHGVGVAMTPMVLRNGVVKSHIVCDLAWIWHIKDIESEYWPLALQLIAHECAHVHDHKIWDLAFPDMFLKKAIALTQIPNIWVITHACWSEYAATRLSARFGKDQTEAYEETFVRTLSLARDRANDHIKRYRIHGKHQILCDEVCKEYGDLMKFASYLIGHLAGLERDLSTAVRAKIALEGHWFAPFFERLRIRLQEQWENYGRWESVSDFDQIGEIANDVLNLGGVFISRLGPGQLQIRVHFTSDTMPM